jgi:hypothetical protein
MLCLMSIVAMGLLSRSLRTGFIVFDKYLGDALYAAMVYALLRLWPATRWSPARVAVIAMALMTFVECFQITGIPARLLDNPQWPVRIVARLLGTQFGFADLAAYALGIAGIGLADHGRTKR